MCLHLSKEWGICFGELKEAALVIHGHTKTSLQHRDWLTLLHDLVKSKVVSGLTVMKCCRTGGLDLINHDGRPYPKYNRSAHCCQWWQWPHCNYCEGEDLWRHDGEHATPLVRVAQLGCIFRRNSSGIPPEFLQLPFTVVTLTGTGSNDRLESVKVM